VRFEMGIETIEAFGFEKDGISQAPVSPVDGKATYAKRIDVAPANPLNRAAIMQCFGRVEVASHT
jgi:hypothetical protein